MTVSEFHGIPAIELEPPGYAPFPAASGVDYYMPDVIAWAKVATYVVCIGLALEFAHRLYWQINAKIATQKTRALWRALVLAVSAAIPLVTVITLTWVFCLYVDTDQMPLKTLGLQLGPASFPLFAGSVTVALVSVTLLFSAGYLTRLFKVRRTKMTRGLLPAFCGGASDFMMAAIFEEITMRGYVFNILNQTWGGVVAVAGSAAIFSAFHLIKHPRMPFIFTLNAFFFGIVTGMARLLTGTLWAPIGLHFGWNMAMGPVFGLPCSGRNYENGLVCSAVDGPEWLTGGLYSPDAGVLGTGALAIATIVLFTIAPMH